ncbi:MAG: hypothetical protein HEQ35_07720 [Gloeotrichia echinulata IR180]|jgi:hypothetical protein|nr:hypothetical protein [Gloeotrichia echinulata DEX184]
MFSRLLFSGVLVLIIWIGLLSSTASSQQVESRLSNLEADFSRFQSRLSQVEAKLNQRRESPSLGVPNNQPQSLTPRRNLSQKERDIVIDRLSTLVVELKQQLNKLETRVSKLESH